MNRTLRIIAIALLGSSQLSVASDPTYEEMLFFESYVRPVLATRCFRCHGPNQQKGELRLDSLAGLTHGGELGPAVDRENPTESLLLQAIAYDGDLQMPPDGKLPEIVEWSDHPWFIGVQFHPELKSKPFDPHPLFKDFVRAAKDVSRLV